MQKKTAYQVLQGVRKAIISLLSVEGVELLSDAQLKQLVESAIETGKNGLVRYEDRIYEATVKLAFRHLEEAQWQQARSKASEALVLKATSRKAKYIIRVANALEETRRLLAQKTPQAAEKSFRLAAESKLKMVIISTIHGELNAALKLEADFNTALNAVHHALVPGENQNFSEAKQQAQVALNTHWDDHAVEQLTGLINATENAALLAEARTAMTNIMTLDTALALVNQVLERNPEHEEALSLKAQIESTINSFAGEGAGDVADTPTSDMDIRQLTKAAQACEEKGDYAKALEHINEALQLLPENEYLLGFKARLEQQLTGPTITSTHEV